MFHRFILLVTSAIGVLWSPPPGLEAALCFPPSLPPPLPLQLPPCPAPPLQRRTDPAAQPAAESRLQLYADLSECSKTVGGKQTYSVMAGSVLGVQGPNTDRAAPILAAPTVLGAWPAWALAPPPAQPDCVSIV